MHCDAWCRAAAFAAVFAAALAAAASSGEDLRLPDMLRGLILRAEAAASELAAPFVEAVGATAATAAAPAVAPAQPAARAAAAAALLASADPAAYWEQRDKEEAEDTPTKEINTTSNDRQVQEELLLQQQQQQLQQQRQLLLHAGASLTWEAEPAEAWSLLCLLYDVEARLAAKARALFVVMHPSLLFFSVSFLPLCCFISYSN